MFVHSMTITAEARKQSAENKLLKCYMINMCVIRSKSRIFIYCHKNINAYFDMPANLNVFQYLILIKGVVTNQNSMHNFYSISNTCVPPISRCSFPKVLFIRRKVYGRHYKTLYLYTRYFEMMAKVSTQKC